MEDNKLRMVSKLELRLPDLEKLKGYEKRIAREQYKAIWRAIYIGLFPDMRSFWVSLTSLDRRIDYQEPTF